MPKDRFVYVTYIRTTPEKLWDALTEPEFTRAYWSGTWHDTTWKPGASWNLMIPDGRVGDSGEVLEVDRPRRLVLKWRNEFRPELRADIRHNRACPGHPRRSEIGWREALPGDSSATAIRLRS